VVVLCHTINAEVNKRATLPGEVPVPDAQGIFKWSETDEGKRWCGAEGELEGKVITQRTIHHLKRIFRSVMKKGLRRCSGHANHLLGDELWAERQSHVRPLLLLLCSVFARRQREL
jgi:hypothetical protein